ncbi:MAG: GNAT family N-acetyltransferase [Ruminococcus sp.]|jgi:ribosomal protein S18 acetylase RimI-like enzyme|nr:GNAT family N-acetyltransferase [Ruminococcus sp.]
MDIRKILYKDYGKIQKFAMQGMNFNMYTENKLELYFYTKYFWYLELNRATQILAAYDGNKLLGVLLADMKNQPKAAYSPFRNLYVKFMEWVMAVGYKGSSDEYEKANSEMLAEFKRTHSPEGELNFFAVDPEMKGKGIGTKLLSELERREKGKLIYLFTNTGNSFYFYERKGFKRSGSRSIEILMHGRKIPHDCYLYSKVI